MSTSRDPSGGAAQELRTFLDAEWKEWLAESPETATAVGFPGFDDRWTDDSPEGVERRRGHLSASLGRITRIDRSLLPEGERLNYDLYREMLESAQAGLRFGFDPQPLRGTGPRNLWMPLTHLDGIHTLAPETLDIQPRRSIPELERYVARLEALPVALDQNRALLATGLAKGFTPPRGPLESLPELVSNLIPSDAASSPLLQPFVPAADALAPSERDRLMRRATEAYAKGIVPAAERLRDYLSHEYVPHCRTSIANTALPDGAAAYNYLVRWHTTTSLTPQEVHALGLAEVQRIREAMQGVMRDSGFPGDFPSFLHFLRTDPQFFFASEEELIDRYRVIAKRTDPALSAVFGRLPRLPYGVLPVPEYRARVSPAAYYIPGVPSTGRPGYFYANAYALDARPRWEMESFVLHESVPGHHLQIALNQELEDVPQFRRFASYSAFIEGWGLYAESLGRELGHYRDPYSRYGQLSFDMWRSIRLVVDTGMHALGWTRERAIQFFLENTGKSEHDVTVEVDRYIVWPAQSLAYKIGQLKFRELRTLAEERLGDRFDVRAFHDVVLGEGALPLPVLEQRVRRWIEARASASR